jgi:RNA polymerase sigma-70 factor, ECF subfamily
MSAKRHRIHAAAALSHAASAGREESFFGWVTQLVHVHRGRLARIVQREGVRVDDALDCVQDAFLSFLKLPQARLLVGLPEELLAILARNIARNRRRRHDYARPHLVDDEIILGLPSDAASADEVVALAEQHALTLGCMVTLNEVQRAVVNLRLVDEVPGEDVARQLGTTPARVGVLLFRARQRLQRCLATAEARPSARRRPVPPPRSRDRVEFGPIPRRGHRLKRRRR